MMTVKEVSDRTGVSIRTLQYYDQIGLLKATAYTEAGYRLYGDAALIRLQQILLFRELEFPLREIRRILSSPDFDGDKALRQQTRLLELKKQHIENLITLARNVRNIGGTYMDFSAFDQSKLDSYARQAKESWGHTAAYQEYAEKSKNRTQETEAALGQDLMAIFAEMGQIKDTDPASEAAQALVQKLQTHITEHYYPCTPQILQTLGQMYLSEPFTKNIDTAAGKGTAQFAHAAIEIYCNK